MYATIAEIRSSSTTIDEVVNAEDEQLTAWELEARVEINRYCASDFAFEQGVEKVFYLDSPHLYLSKTLSGINEVLDVDGNLVNNDFLDYDLGSRYIRVNTFWRYGTQNAYYRKRRKLTLRGDFGYAVSKLDLVQRLANQLKSKYEAHRVSTTFHTSPDTANAITASTATNLNTAMALLNDLKVQVNAHILDTSVHDVADTTNIVTAPSATNQDTAIELANDLKAKFNAHRVFAGHEASDTSNVVTAHLNNAILPDELKLVTIRLVQRLALRNTDKGNLMQYNSFFVSEKTGDEYSYDMRNGTIRSLLRPEDQALLWDYVNHGQVIW